MKMYKIITLGEVFYFLDKAYRGNRMCGSDGITVWTDVSDNLDFIFDFDTTKICMSDFLRASSAYLFGAVGLPCSDYRIITPCGSIAVNVPGKHNRKFGGNVGKCKVLFSEKAVKSECGEMEFYVIDSERGKYRAVLCDNAESFDINCVGAYLLRDGVSSGGIRGVLAVSYNGNAAYLKARIRDNGGVADSMSYAAAFSLLCKSGVVEDSTHIKSAHGTAFCKADGLDTYSVFDISPQVLSVVL